MLHARNRGVQTLFIHALSENTAMLRIARNAGATVERDGPESEAWLRLRKVPVEVTRPSNHVALVRFSHGVTPFAGSSTAVSRREYLAGRVLAALP